MNCITALKGEIKTADSMLFEEVEKKVSERERFVTEQSERLKEIEESFNTLVDYQQVLVRAQKLQITGNVPNLGADQEGGNINASNPDFREESKNLLISHQERELSFAHIAGTIDSTEKLRMKKLLFRATKGTTLVVFSDFEEPQRDSLGKSIIKSAYYVTFQDVEHIRNRVMRIVESFNGQRFEIPPASEITRKVAEIKIQIADA